MKLKHFWMTTATATLIAGSALAQDTATPETGVADGSAETAIFAPSFASLAEMTVADMIGMIAYDPDGNQISEIDYVIAGMGGPEAVLGIGGFLGLGEYTVALPLNEFELGEDGASLQLNTDRETLKTYPEFDESTAESLPGETSIGTLLAEAGGGDTTTPDAGTAGGDAQAVTEATPDDAATDGGTMADDGDMADDDTDEDAAGEETTTQ